MTDRWAFEVYVDEGDVMAHETGYDYATEDAAFVDCFLWLHGFGFQGDPTEHQVWGYVVREGDEDGSSMVTVQAGLPTTIHYSTAQVSDPITVYCDDGNFLGSNESGGSYWGEGYPPRNHPGQIVMAWNALPEAVREMVKNRTRETIDHLEMENA